MLLNKLNSFVLLFAFTNNKNIVVNVFLKRIHAVLKYKSCLVESWFVKYIIYREKDSRIKKFQGIIDVK
jgi:hypothetical protein